MINVWLEVLIGALIGIPLAIISMTLLLGREFWACDSMRKSRIKKSEIKASRRWHDERSNRI